MLRRDARFDVDTVRFRASDALPVHSLSSESLRWWLFDVWKAEGDLDANGKIRVFDDAEDSHGNALKF